MATPTSPTTVATENTLKNTAKVDREEDGLFFNPPLYSQRAQLVHNVLQRYGCRRIVDAGCSYGDLLLFVMNASSLSHVQVTQVTAIDVDGHAVSEVSRVLPFSGFSVASYTEDCAVQCIRGDLTSPATIPAAWLPYSPPPSTASAERPSDVCGGRGDDDADGNGGVAAVDAVFSIEVVEHIPPHLVAAYTYTLFAELGAARGARVALLTTPNRDENGRLPRSEPPQEPTTGVGVSAHCSTAENSIYRPWERTPRRRHDEHFFELTRAQWLRYVRYVETCYGDYWSGTAAVLLGGAFTQGTLFVSQRQPPHGACAISRDAAIAAFPFEGIFGMSRADYDAHFLSSAETRDDGGCAVPYTRMEHRVVEGVGLWDRLQTIVRRGCANYTFANAVGVQSGGTATSLPFRGFYTTSIAPLLSVMLAECTLPLLLRTLMAQRSLWVQAVQQDTVQWRRFATRQRDQQPLLRVEGLRAAAAHAPPSHRGVSLSIPPVVSTVPCTYGESLADGAAIAVAVGSDGVASSHCGPALPLFPFPSEAYLVLSRARGDASLRSCAAEGVWLLEKGTTDSLGLLLVEWLRMEVALYMTSSVNDGHCEDLTPSPFGAAPSKLLSSSVLCAAPSTRTMKCLPMQLLQLLFFLVSADVLPDSYAALHVGWGHRERHFPTLYRDVQTLRGASAAVAGAPRRHRRRRGRRLAVPADGTRSPYWLERLLQYPVCLS